MKSLFIWKRIFLYFASTSSKFLTIRITVLVKVSLNIKTLWKLNLKICANMFSLDVSFLPVKIYYIKRIKSDIHWYNERNLLTDSTQHYRALIDALHQYILQICLIIKSYEIYNIHKQCLPSYYCLDSIKVFDKKKLIKYVKLLSKLLSLFI